MRQDNPVHEALHLWKSGQEAAAKFNTHAAFHELPGILVVPNILRDAIYEKMAAGFLVRPELFWPSSKAWNDLYRDLLRFFDEHGYIPEFIITRKHERAALLNSKPTEAPHA